jgi:hypothetical protein
MTSRVGPGSQRSKPTSSPLWETQHAMRPLGTANIGTEATALAWIFEQRIGPWLVPVTTLRLTYIPLLAMVPHFQVNSRMGWFAERESLVAPVRDRPIRTHSGRQSPAHRGPRTRQ